jgi:cellulose synthase/poly-beta-1,6-N-acetylglucosamine synthase-like glycosyltransferase
MSEGRHGHETVLPEPNARRVLCTRQRLGAGFAAVVLGLCLVLDWRHTFFVLNLGCILLYLVFAVYKLALQFLSLGSAPAHGDAPPARLPFYTLLVPLYREALALPGLVAHLAGMDYPADRMEVLLLVEEDDERTRSVLARTPLPANMRAIIVPFSLPRTKPKACNLGLRAARGDLLVVYDAEDRPERDQLRKAAAAFACAPPEVACFQARLNFYNRTRNLLTRLFSVEYSTWFDLCLPGLFLVDAPIPLGGTSNHFRVPALRALGGWDPYNVTEDCDLGIRLYARQWRTHCLDSTTWEEATTRLAPWIRQRSRWIKGYIQTYLVHLRHGRRLLARLGPGGIMHFHLLFGATGFCLLINPLFWALAGLWTAGRADWISGLYPPWILFPALACLLAGNAMFVLSGMLACIGRRTYRLLPCCLLMPAYWVLMSIAAWKGALQLFRKPHFWEKTPHGKGVRLADAFPADGRPS